MRDIQFYGARDGRGDEETGVHRDGDELTLVIGGHRVRFEDIDDALFLAERLRAAHEDALNCLP
jgi:hypothetical protein